MATIRHFSKYRQDEDGEQPEFHLHPLNKFPKVIHLRTGKFCCTAELYFQHLELITLMNNHPCLRIVEFPDVQWDVAMSQLVHSLPGEGLLRKMFFKTLFHENDTFSGRDVYDLIHRHGASVDTVVPGYRAPEAALAMDYGPCLRKLCVKFPLEDLNP